jgi:hypothetical protein
VGDAGARDADTNRIDSVGTLGVCPECRYALPFAELPIVCPECGKRVMAVGPIPLPALRRVHRCRMALILTVAMLFAWGFFATRFMIRRTGVGPATAYQLLELFILSVSVPLALVVPAVICFRKAMRLVRTANPYQILRAWDFEVAGWMLLPVGIVPMAIVAVVVWMT